MNVAVKDMTIWGPWWRRGRRKTTARAGRRRKPVVPVTRSWEGISAALHSALIMASGLVLAGILGWVWSSLVDPKVLPIKRVQVQGSFVHVQASAVRKTVTPFITGNFLTVDVRRVQQAVQAMPWVRQAEVRRAWPDALQISVIEQVAVAKWGADALINKAGTIFKPPLATHPAALPTLQGPEGSGEIVVRALRGISEIIMPLGLHVKRLNFDERRAWSLELDNGIQVVLGRGNGYGRLLKFVRFYRRAFHGQENNVERVDLRYSNGFAVSWRQTGKTQ